MQYVLVIIAFLLTESKAHAYGSVVLSGDYKDINVITNAPSPNEARDRNLQWCSQNVQPPRECRVVALFYQQCVVTFYSSYTGLTYFAVNSVYREANAAAYQQCLAATQVGFGGNACTQRTAICDTTAAHVETVQNTQPQKSQAPAPGWFDQYLPRHYVLFYSQYILNDPHTLIALCLLTLGISIAVFLTFLVPFRSTQINLPPPSKGNFINAAVKHVQTLRGFTLYVTIRFSQEAERIIRAGRLHYSLITAPTAPNTPEVLSQLLVYIIIAIAYLPLPLFLFGFGWGVAGGGTYAGVTMLAAVVLLLFLRYGPIQLNKGVPRAFMLPDLLKTPTIKLYAPDIITAQILEQEIKENLQQLRELLPNAPTIPRDSSIEL